MNDDVIGSTKGDDSHKRIDSALKALIDWLVKEVEKKHVEESIKPQVNT